MTLETTRALMRQVQQAAAAEKKRTKNPGVLNESVVTIMTLPMWEEFCFELGDSPDMLERRVNGSRVILVDSPHKMSASCVDWEWQEEAPMNEIATVD